MAYIQTDTPGAAPTAGEVWNLRLPCWILRRTTNSQQAEVGLVESDNKALRPNLQNKTKIVKNEPWQRRRKVNMNWKLEITVTQPKSGTSLEQFVSRNSRCAISKRFQETLGITATEEDGLLHGLLVRINPSGCWFMQDTI